MLRCIEWNLTSSTHSNGRNLIIVEYGSVWNDKHMTISSTLRKRKYLSYFILLSGLKEKVRIKWKLR